jgi:hypothetical protein
MTRGPCSHHLGLRLGLKNRHYQREKDTVCDEAALLFSLHLLWWVIVQVQRTVPSYTDDDEYWPDAHAARVRDVSIICNRVHSNYCEFETTA